MTSGIEHIPHHHEAHTAPSPSPTSKWSIVAFAVSSAILLGAAAFGGMGLFASQLPQGLASAVGTIGHSGCLAMFMAGTLLGGTCAITTMIGLIKRNHILNHLNSLLLTAATTGNTQEVITLLDRGANIEARSRDVSNSTPLMSAAYRGQVDVIRILLDRGANIEARDTQGWTPLMCAACTDRADTIRVLLDRGANIEARSHCGSTPLMIAVSNGGLDSVNSFLHRGANIEARDREGKTPLMLAVSRGSVDIVRAFLIRRANYETVDLRGITVTEYVETEDVRQILHS